MSTTSLTCVALLGALLFGLGLAVSLTRAKTSCLIGHPAGREDFLHKLVRAHGNTAEYVPLLAVLMLALGSRPAVGWVDGVIVGTTVARFAIVVGLLAFRDLGKPNPVRFLGALGTYLGGLALSGALVA